MLYIGYGLLGRLALRARKSVQALGHPRRHARLARAMRRSHESGVYRPGGSSFWKYLDLYLAHRLSTAARARIIAHHYRFLEERLPGGPARAAWTRGATFWSSAGPSGRLYQATCGQLARAPREGEAELTLLADGEMLATLTFAIAPGAAFALPDRHLLVIGGVQGVAGRREAIRIAAKDHNEVAPVALLLLAARALAETLGLDRLLCISSAEQVEQGRLGFRLKADYDRLWSEAGAQPLADGLFMLDAADGGERSLDHLSSAHRKRARRKAAAKAAMRAAMAEGLQALFVHGRPVPWLAAQRPPALTPARPQPKPIRELLFG